ncbi:hypothetical protein HJP15_19910 [Pseudoalteromonas sp. NEC-BIFX-2020_002]|uniref:EpsG family protein n=1 Tax=Pseudoalteromonas sp. NEC-BIFX-2020_002 TaxID=2732353 RepID=UPI001476B3B6|nr:EpsG family protein [Pseudoalteromonas sp. NEC-BIFX-2020_002]NNG45155.1 hypothetical protein [Pseudoalteromonas sp. NEC-BIFX-2020_002]
MLLNINIFNLCALDVYKNTSNRQAYYIYLCVFFASIYALMLSSLPVNETIVDRINYIYYAEKSHVIFARYQSKGLFSVLFNEPLWLIVNIVLSSIGDPTFIIKVIVFSSSFTVAYFVLTTNPKGFLFLLLLLLFPQVIGKFIVHIRQGFAISIFILGIMSGNERVRFFLIICTPFIHSSFFFIVFFAALCSQLQTSKLGEDVSSVVAVFISLLLGSSILVVGTFLGARQVSEDSVTTSASGFGFVFWSAILVLYYLAGKDFIRRYIFSISCIVLYLATYFFTVYTARIFESGLIFAVLAALNLSPMRRLMAYSLFVFLFLISIFGRLGRPLLGFGL